MRRLPDVSIKGKLFILWLLPLPLLLYLWSSTTSHHLDQKRDGERMYRLSVFTDTLVNLVGTLQVERDLALGYLGNEDPTFAQALEQQAARTNAALANVVAREKGLGFSDLGVAYNDALALATDRVEQLKLGRVGIRAARASARDVLEDYIDSIERFLALIRATSQFSNDSRHTEMLLAFESLLSMQEAMAVESAILTNAFAAEAFGSGMFERLQKAVRAQEILHGLFESHALPEQLEIYNTITTQVGADSQVDAMRALAFERAGQGDFAVDPIEWFSRQNARVALWSELQHAMAGQLGSESQALAEAASQALWMFAGVTLTTVLLALLLTGRLAKALTRSLSETASRLTIASAELRRLARQQASGAQEQAAAVEETGTSIAEVAKTSEKTADRAQAVSESARIADEIGKVGSQAIADTRSAMTRTKEQVDLTAGSIVSLAERTQAIGEIIGSVTEIAEQTNLLALNAAIEASRAGEHGKGFSIVAGEVKVLAGQAKHATGQVREILEEIQGATNKAVLSTEQGTKQVDDAMTVVAQAGETIGQLTETIGESYKLSTQIASSATQQATGLGQIQGSIEEISTVANRSLGSSEILKGAVETLTKLSGELGQLVGVELKASEGDQAETAALA